MRITSVSCPETHRSPGVPDTGFWASALQGAEWRPKLIYYTLLHMYLYEKKFLYFLIKKLYLFLFYVSECFARTCLCTMSVQCLWRPEEGVRVSCSCELPNPGPQQEQPLLENTDVSHCARSFLVGAVLSSSPQADRASNFPTNLSPVLIDT